MAERERCPNCGSGLPVDAPRGLCPACLLRQALDTDESATGATLEGAGPNPGAGTTVGLDPGPAARPPGTAADQPVSPGGGPGGDAGPLSPGALVRPLGDYEL